MAIAELMAVLPLPSSPFEVGGIDKRKQVEQTLGIVLPTDFWDYGLTYGSGTIAYSDELSSIDLIIYNPTSPVFQACVDADCNTLRVLKRSISGDEVPYGVFPDIPGLLPWGSSTNGDTFFWLTEGNVDSWPLIIWGEGGDKNEFERFDMPMTVFLSRLLKHDVVPLMWKDTSFFSIRNAISFRPNG